MQAQQVIEAITAICDRGSQFLLGDQITLADIYLLPVMQYFLETKPGRRMVDQNEAISTWWEQNSSRPGIARILENPETTGG